MILLDTNVVSEPMRAHGAAAVIAWLDNQVAESLHLSATSLAELLVGIERLPAGRRRDGLAEALAGLLDRLFGPRILPFDRDAARAFAELAAIAQAKGEALSFADGQIAAVARVHGLTVATRDRRPFEAVGIAVIDPWTDS